MFTTPRIDASGQRPFRVLPDRGEPIEVFSSNWMSALGDALAKQGGSVSSLSRVVIEVLPNGTVIARDAVGGDRWVVQTVDAAPTMGSDVMDEWVFGPDDTLPPAPSRQLRMPPPSLATYRDVEIKPANLPWIYAVAMFALMAITCLAGFSALAR